MKYNAAGAPLLRKFHLAIADARSRAGSLFDAETYAGAVDLASVRFLANLTHGRELETIEPRC